MSQPPYPPFPGIPPVPPDHPQAKTVLILGIVGKVLCGITGPFAVVMGARVRREIREANGALGGMSQATVGWALGIVDCVVLVLVGLYFGFILVLAATGNMTS
jgi:hypothetical protein